MKFPLLQARLDNTWEVMEDFQYKSVVVPKGYRTNGSNIPRWLWSVIPPNKPLYSAAYTVHDYLCDNERYKLADKYFAELLYNVDYGMITKSMVIAVEGYHKLKYGK